MVRIRGRQNEPSGSHKTGPQEIITRLSARTAAAPLAGRGRCPAPPLARERGVFYQEPRDLARGRRRHVSPIIRGPGATTSPPLLGAGGQEKYHAEVHAVRSPCAGRVPQAVVGTDPGEDPA